MWSTWTWMNLDGWPQTSLIFIISHHPQELGERVIDYYYYYSSPSCCDVCFFESSSKKIHYNHNTKKKTRRTSREVLSCWLSKSPRKGDTAADFYPALLPFLGFFSKLSPLYQCPIETLYLFCMIWYLPPTFPLTFSSDPLVMDHDLLFIPILRKTLYMRMTSHTDMSVSRRLWGRRGVNSFFKI